MTSKNIRVCAFSYYFPPHFSGAGFYALTLAKEFAKKDIPFTFVTVDNTGLPRHDIYQGFDIYRVADGPKKHGEFVLWWNLSRTFHLIRGQFDIIHAFGSTYKNSAVGPIAKLLGKKSLTTVSMANNDLHPITARSVAGRVQACFLRQVDRYISLSRQISEEIKTLPLDPRKAVEIPQGVDHHRFRPASETEKSDLRLQLHLPNGQLALYVGVFDGRKNVKWLVETWTKYRDRFSDWHLILVGPSSRDRRDAELRDNLRKLVHENGLVERILFRDFCPTIEDYYRAADIFILPSQNEGMPNVVVEAMASGLPCVVTLISGTTDLIEHGRSGMLFEVNSEASFLAAMEPIAQEQKTRLCIGARARRFVLQRFSTETVVERYLEVYREMLGGQN